MATTPASTTNLAQAIQPVFKRVQQACDHDCAFACIAMIVNKSLADVLQVAIDKFGHPAHGPYWIDETLIAKLFAHYGFVSTIYKEVETGISDVPDVAIVMTDYDPETELGRHVVFVRDKSNPKQVVEYMIDPAHWIAPSLHIRNDFKTLVPAWYIGIHPMGKPVITPAKK
jgi:hypothetical protein